MKPNKITKEESLQIIDLLIVIMYANGKVLEQEIKYIEMVAEGLGLEDEVSKRIKKVHGVYAEEATIGLEVLLDSLIEEIKENRQVIYNLAKRLVVIDYYIYKIEEKYLDKMKKAWEVIDIRKNQQ